MQPASLSTSVNTRRRKRRRGPCRKVCYLDIVFAAEQRGYLQSQNLADPGLQIYGCRRHGLTQDGKRRLVYHVGHAGDYRRSLGYLMKHLEEAG